MQIKYLYILLVLLSTVAFIECETKAVSVSPDHSNMTVSSRDDTLIEEDELDMIEEDMQQQASVIAPVPVSEHATTSSINHKKFAFTPMTLAPEVSAKKTASQAAVEASSSPHVSRRKKHREPSNASAMRASKWMILFACLLFGILN